MATDADEEDDNQYAKTTKDKDLLSMTGAADLMKRSKTPNTDDLAAAFQHVAQAV